MLASWAAYVQLWYGSGTQGRLAANASLFFLLLIVEGSDFASGAQV
jgi:hypothetical protein